MPETLEVRALPRGAAKELQIAAPLPRAHSSSALTATSASASWELEDLGLAVTASLAGPRLSLRLSARTTLTLEWPLTARDSAVTALVLPVSEGLCLPARDPFWLKLWRDGEEFSADGGLSMPFWGVEAGSIGITYMLKSDLRTRLTVEPDEGRLVARAGHLFSQRDGFPPYELAIQLSRDASPITPALEYRRWLEERGEAPEPLSRRWAGRPAAARLAGAIHAYLWGDGRTAAAVGELRALGVERALLIYDTGPPYTPSPISAAFVQACTAAGFLAGPYDTLLNVQPPDTADDRASIFDRALYETGGVLKEDGRRMAGFAGRGYELSSEALRRAKTPFLARRAAEAKALGANAYFMDSDAFGELLDDYDPLHPMTPETDRRNRLERLRYLGETCGFAVGSESAASWAAGVLDFSHGTETPQMGLLWHRLRDKKTLGGYWPPERPGLFFKELDADEKTATALFSPRYRVPLYQAALHDRIVCTDRWEFGVTKYRDLADTRTLLSLLYGVPSMWNLDRKAIARHGPRLTRLAKFFGPLHRRIATLPMTAFERLAAGVARSRFGGEVELTADFGRRTLEAHWLKDGRREVFRP